jgi:uncharacterized protein (DUF1015 family)
MAEVQPFPGLHYDLARVGSLQAVAAPPYDVIDAAQRAELQARSPYNVVEVDLPRAGKGEDPYRHAASTLADWELEGILRRDREPALWALTQEYAAPDGSRLRRHAILARVRVEEYGPGRVRPHERTQPGPKQDRLELTRATRHNLSPIFSLTSKDAWPRIEPATASDPWAEVTDDDGTLHRVWRVLDPAVHEVVAAELAEAELFIADGHHRYETARAYMQEVGGEGAHCYTLMALTALEDRGLTVFPTHRLLSGLADDTEKRERLREGLRELFEVEEVSDEELDPPGEKGLGVFGFIDAHHSQPLRLRLKDTAELDRMLEGRSEPYRRLDVVILETLVLKGILGMSEEDIAAKRGIGYAKSVPEVKASLEGRDYEAAFILRPTPIEQVREVAATGETMPPKSTYFFPKLLTGIAFNPLE